MPHRPHNPCATPGCTGRATHGRCATCRSRRHANADAIRGTAAVRGYDRVWRARRLDYLVRNPWCALCTQAATVADHYPDSRRDLVAAGVPDLDADYRLRPLCTPCHGRETALHQPGGWNRGGTMPARPPQECRRPGCTTMASGGLCTSCRRAASYQPAGGAVTFVAGPPCAGKTTYVAQHRKPADLVVDVDALRVALGGGAAHEQDSARLPFVLAAREAVLARLTHPHGVPAVWVVACAPLRAQREIIAGARIVVLSTSAKVCHARADAERPPVWHRLIDEWFAAYQP